MGRVDGKVMRPGSPLPSPVLRAAGAYAEEVALQFGLLLLKSAVGSGLKLQDGANYIPDERLLPTCDIQLRKDVIHVWREHRSFVGELSVFLEYGHGLPANLTNFEHAFQGWDDPMPFALGATAMRPKDALAHCTLAANYLRAGKISKSKECLHKFINQWDGRPVPEMARVSCNLAAILDAEGDVSSAQQLIRKVSLQYPKSVIALQASQALQTNSLNQS